MENHTRTRLTRGHFSIDLLNEKKINPLSLYPQLNKEKEIQ